MSVNKNEVISNCAEVAIGILARLDTTKSIFPNGILEESSGNPRYTKEAQDVFDELVDVYNDIFSEHSNT